ncbi:FAD-binding oxidoreductase, partial [Mesorhizobium sp. M2D.F.Ca.ET.145.01.1.1]
MAEEQKGFRLSRRLLLGAAVLGGAVLWGGTTVARLARGPSGPKNTGRIADIDGIALPLKPIDNAPAFDPSLPWLAKGGDINDASGLSRTPVYGVVEVSEEEHIAKALAFARANGLKVSLAAIRHSMGGHAFDDNALVLDLRPFNKVTVDAAARTMTLQPGARWHDIQTMLHPRFAVKAMQSTDIFSVGGSLSVNAHGMDHQAGSVAGSIRSMRVMLAD